MCRRSSTGRSPRAAPPSTRWTPLTTHRSSRTSRTRSWNHSGPAARSCSAAMADRPRTRSTSPPNSSGARTTTAPPRPGLALTVDTSALTAIGNDYGYDTVFSRQVEALGNAGDVLIGISTSGRSANVVRAIEAAKAKGITTVSFTGYESRDMGNRRHPVAGTCQRNGQDSGTPHHVWSHRLRPCRAHSVSRRVPRQSLRRRIPA